MSKRLRDVYQDILPEEMVKKLEDYQHSLEAHIRLINLLTQDYDALLNQMQLLQNDQAFRRTLARTLFALVEGTVFALKQWTLDKFNLGLCDLSRAEYALLAEESYDLKDNGDPRVSQRFIRLEVNIKFAISLYAKKVGGFQHKLNAGDEKWANFIHAIEVRNRLMHPKSVTDLLVSDKDLSCIVAAASWFKESIGGVALKAWAANNKA